MGTHRYTNAYTDRVRRAWRAQPFSLALAITMVPVGLLALVLGDTVSKALTNISGEFVSHVMGAFMLSGGLTALWGIARPGVTYEAVGLSLMAAGTGIYGLGVVLGLGMGGMVAGPGYIVMTVAILRRVQLLLAMSQRVNDDKRAISDG